MELTEWYPPDIKPVHVGYYHTRMVEMESGYNWWWDGTQWCLWSPEDAKAHGPYIRVNGTNVCGNQSWSWRGMKEKE